MTTNRALIFCDFDGTIARTDVGYRMFHHFSGGRNEELLPDWKAGIMSSREILRREAAMVQTKPGELDTFLDSMELDPGFVSFVILCEQSGLIPIVLSEGLDFYISRILERYSLGHLPIVANHGIVENNGISIEFPHLNKNCSGCGSCKGERIDEYRARSGEEVTVVFVGDGYSDACAAGRADLLLAKKDLAVYCRKNQIEYTPFDDFHDVSAVLVKRGLLGTK